MSIIHLRNITLSHGGLPLLQNANLRVESGERVCLIGRNGVGKSTLLKLIHGDIEPDNGKVECNSSLKIALLTQTIPAQLDGCIFDIVATGLEELSLEDWNKEHRVESILSKLALEGDVEFSSLSGGLKRRVLLAKALVSEPDLLLLDEPTNHLDIDAITQLEKFLLNFKKTLFFVTHDRVLMQKLATHIVEIDNGQLISWRGHYNDYLKFKQTSLEAEARANALFDKRLAEEEAWIRQGIKARRTRNEGRVRSLMKMREERHQRRVRTGQVNMSKQDIKPSGKIIFDIENITYQYKGEEKPTIKDFSTIILRGDKIGIIGPNGSGKSTLLNLLLGKLIPDKGSIKYGTKLEIAYFDQHRSKLDETKSVLDNVCEGSEIITIGEKSKHIMSYLQDFLFSPERARSPLKVLSGGERNRVILAKLFLKPCNVLVMDEPTNDLDVDTLELLEEQLFNFQGTLLLVSHDRDFLNNVVTSTLVMEGKGYVGEYVGGYEDWLRQRKVKIANFPKKTKQIPEVDKQTVKNKKRSNQKKRMLELLPRQIEKLEAEQTELQKKLSDPEFYRDDPDDFIKVTKQLQNIEIELENAYLQWSELEDE